MSELNKHMDDAFKKMSEDLKVTYDKSFWESAKAKLDDANLDDAFKAAASAMEVSPALDATEGIDDMFMDAAFVDASSEASVSYDSSFFEEFMNQQGDLIMDEAFNEASSSVTVDYLPQFWNDADRALRNEGLHYEYDSAYWAEARKLLDRSDRKVFFTRWTSVAIALLLISFGGQQFLSTSITNVNGIQASESHNESELVVSGNNLSEVVLANELKVEDNNSINSSTSNDNSEEGLAHHEMVHTNDNGSAHNSGSQLTLENAQEITNGTDTRNPLDQAIENLETTNETNAQITLIDNNSVGSSTRNPLDNVIEVVESSSTIGTLEVLGTQQTNSVISTDMNLLNSPEIHSIDRNSNTLKMPKVTIEQIKPRTVHSLSVVGGSGIGNKWGSFSFLPTLRNSVGLEYMTCTVKRFKNLELGGSLMLNHVKQNNFGYEDRISVYNTYGGVTKYSRSVQLKNMVYGNANFLVNHRLSPRHKMKFGVGFEYLLAANSNMSFIDGKVQQVTIVNDNWGVKEGLNKFDVRFTVGYEYQLTNTLALQLNTNYGMFDRTDDFYLKSDEKNVEIGVMLGLKYNLFRLVR